MTSSDKIHRQSIRLEYENQVKSLVWQGDTLLDVIAGGTTFFLNGNIEKGGTYWGYRFDGVVASDDGVYTVLFERFGTKGVLLKYGQQIREVNRSYYHANAYEYPVCFCKISKDEWGIAHCPDEYNVIEIESAETGKRVTSKERTSTDFFHSRLQVSPENKWLLSAGWIWHPLDSIMLFDLSKSFENSQSDCPFWDGGLSEIGLWEINNATFISDSQLLLSGEGDHIEEDASEEKAIVVYDLVNSRVISRSVVSEPTGRLMPINQVQAISFYRYPKLIDILSGEIIYKWEDIETDETNSSISFLNRHSVIALDRNKFRFAVAKPNSIEIVTLH